ncbi:MAG: undecaprenyl-diphosphate phosphatase [Clostridiales bacterium]|nr:undecaprenyl-diphosphate phosphatase [Clostridiales bacterium]
MSWFEALVAGIIQGVTEFLPISSSGHLVIFGTLLGEGAGTGAGANLAFAVWLHLATLLAVVIVYRKDVWLLLRELVGAIADLFRGRPDFKSPGRRYLLMVIVGTIPAVLAGGTVKVLGFEGALENIFVVAVLLLVTAAFMFSVDRVKEGTLTPADAPLGRALLVGLFQAAAIFPGLSRSGSTIFGGVLGGFKKEFAVRFAFIMSIPAILGATFVELSDAMEAGGLGVEPVSLAAGFVAALVFGMIAIRVIKVLARSGKFYIFGVYCLGASVFAFLVGGGIISV